jgi:hypothetical protein
MTTPLLQRVAKLIPYPTKHPTVPAIAFAYHFEPSADQQLQAGSLFVVIEVMAKESLARQIIDLVIKTMGEEYYNKKFRDEPELRFEKSIATLNQQLAKLHTSQHAKHITDFSAVIAVVQQDQLYLSQCGKAHARLYRKAKMTDLADGLNSGSTPQKTFYGIAEGSLKSKDKLLFATPAVLFEFESRSLDQLVIDNSPARCVHKMSSQLKGESSNTRCAALTIELSDLELAASEPLESDPDTAMVGKAQTKLGEVSAVGTPVVIKSVTALKSVVQKSTLWWRTRALPAAKHRTKTVWNALWTKYINPNPRKALGIGAGIIAILIVGSYLYSASTTNYRALVTDYKEIIALTESAEAKQSLGKADDSSPLIQSATTKLTALTKAYSSQQIERALQSDEDLNNQKNISAKDLRSRLQVLNDKLSNITRPMINNIVDFTSFKGFTAEVIASLGDRLYTVDTSSGTLYQIDPSKKSSVVAARSNLLKSTLAITPSSSGDSLFILTSTPSVVQFTPGKSLIDVKLSGGSWAPGIAIASYIGNLYILSPQNSQIYRHSRTSIGFSASSSYIKRSSTASIAKASSIAINGSILLSDGTNKITTFSNGVGEANEVKDLPKLVKGIARLQLQGSESVYALSADASRIIRISINDTGYEFEQQYVFPTALADFTLSSDNTLYGIVGKKVVSAKL